MDKRGERRLVLNGMAHLKLDELVVHRRSEELADHCWNLVRAWDSFARETVGKQLIRAADSIGANIAEGFGRASTADNQRFVRIARGPCTKCVIS